MKPERLVFSLIQPFVATSKSIHKSPERSLVIMNKFIALIIGSLFLFGLVVLLFSNFLQLSQNMQVIARSTAAAATEQYILENEPPPISIDLHFLTNEEIADRGCTVCYENTVSITGIDVVLEKVQFFDNNGQEVSYNCERYGWDWPITKYGCYKTNRWNPGPAVKVCVNVKKTKNNGTSFAIDKVWQICRDI